MSFADLLSKEVQQSENNGGNNQNTQFLQLGKKSPEGYKVLVRVLPTVQPDGHFGILYRKAIINYFGTKPGQDTPANHYKDIVAPYGETNYAEQKLLQWLGEGKQLSQFPMKGLKQTFMMNVVKVIENADRTLSYNTDEQGNMLVQPFEVPYTAYQSLMKAINEPRNTPQGCNSEYSFVSAEVGAPIEFEKPKQGSGVMQWTVTPFIQMSGSLPPLPQGWENSLNDLNKIVQPTSDEFVKTYLEPAFEETANTNMQDIGSQIPSNLGGQPQPQQPVQQQPQQPVQQPQAPVQQNSQPDVNWDKMAQQQQQPEGNNNPFAGWSPSSVDDTQIPFESQQQNTQPQQPVQPQQPSQQQAGMNVPPQPEQPQQQSQPQTNQEPPAQPQGGNNLPPDISKLIEQSQQQ